MAIEKQHSGGAALLDEDLTYVKLNKQEKQRLLTALHAQQAALTKHPIRLNRIIEAIPEAPLILDWLYRWIRKFTTSGAVPS